jgi:hypothetical protein
MSADLTTLGRKIDKLASVEHRKLVRVKRREPTCSTADQPSRYVQGGVHSAFLKLWPGISFKVSEAVIHRDDSDPFRQRESSPNAFQQLPNGQRVKTLRKQSI